MAETIHYETRKEQYAIHHISCDKCGKHICDSAEYDDGYYHDPSRYEQKIYVDGWYRLKANLCDECKSKTTAELIKLLTDFGFEKERDTRGRCEMTKKEYFESTDVPKGYFIPQWTNPLYECPKCGGHVCRSNTMELALTCNPPIYQDSYRCMDCGFEEYISR